jgi:hypothetical protein
MQMTHQHYHEVEARTPEHCGHELGLMFGTNMQRYIAEACSERRWDRLKRNAVPLLNSTAEHFPTYVSELRAFAAAAKVALLDLWTVSVADELDDGVPERCTTIVTNNGRMLGHNEDWDCDSSEEICVLKKKCRGITTLELYYYACPLGGSALTICSNGYIQAVNSICGRQRTTGVPKLVLARRFSELKNVDTQLSGILVIPRSSGFAHTLVDRSGRLTLIEATANSCIARRSGAPFVHTNHAISPELASERMHDQRGTLARYETALQKVSASMSQADLIRLLSDAAQGERHTIFNDNTIAKAVVDLTERTVSFWLRREAKLGWLKYDIEFFFS